MAMQITETQEIFEIERAGDTLVLIPVKNLRELDFRQIEEGAARVLDLLERTNVRNLVLDFQHTDYYGSTALGFFVKLWKRVKTRKGNMAFCHISPHELEILRVTKLDTLWPIFGSREDALASFGEG